MFEVQDHTLAELPVERFAALEMYEKDDLQRLLRNDISPLGNEPSGRRRGVRPLGGRPPDRAFRVLPGQLTDQQAVIEELSLHVGRKNLGRYFTEHALIDEVNDETYVLSKMWGRDTEPTLALLSEAFPDANIGVVRANADNE